MSNATTTEEEDSAPAAGRQEGSVRLVTQRCDSARLLLDNENSWASIGRGLVVLVSFASGAEPEAVERAARAVLGAPLLTLGVWGDGSPAESLLTLRKAGHEVSLMVIPQAGMTSRLKGKVLTYRDQLDKDQSRALYSLFVSTLRRAAAEALAEGEDDHGAAYRERVRAARAKGQLDPKVMFTQGDYAGKYSKFDERGVPTHDADGKELAKAAKKKLEKCYASQSKKFAKYKDAPEPAGEDDAAEGGASDQAAPAEEFECPLKVVAGTFGNRQGYQVESNMGPFTHIFSF